jgi:heme exporter protein D
MTDLRTLLADLPAYLACGLAAQLVVLEIPRAILARRRIRREKAARLAREALARAAGHGGLRAAIDQAHDDLFDIASLATHCLEDEEAFGPVAARRALEQIQREAVEAAERIRAAAPSHVS